MVALGASTRSGSASGVAAAGLGRKISGEPGVAIGTPSPTVPDPAVGTGIGPAAAWTAPTEAMAPDSSNEVRCFGLYGRPMPPGMRISVGAVVVITAPVSTDPPVGAAPPAPVGASTSGSSKNPPPAGTWSLARIGGLGRRSPKLPNAVGADSAWMDRVLSASAVSRYWNRSKGRLAARPAAATSMTFGRAPNT